MNPLNSYDFEIQYYYLSLIYYFNFDGGDLQHWQYCYDILSTSKPNDDTEIGTRMAPTVHLPATSYFVDVPIL